MSQKQKSRYFDNVWASSLIGIVFVIIYFYMDYSMIDFLLFDQISLFLYAVIPGSLVMMAIWTIIKSKQIKEIPKKSVVFLVVFILLSRKSSIIFTT